MSAKSATRCQKKYLTISENLNIKIGTEKFTHKLIIRCPQEKNGRNFHEILRNGKDFRLKSPIQKYMCKTCHKSFYAHTLLFFHQILQDLKTNLYSMMNTGKLNSSRIRDHLGSSAAQSHRILEKILINIVQNTKIRKINQINRNSNTLLVDETFITIGNRTWYLIVVISGNNKIMGFKFVKRRTKQEMFQLISDCASRLNYKFKMLVTDGLSVYKGVALMFKIPLIHIQHIHAPPFGYIIINTIEYTKHNVHITKAKTTNDILMYEGYFLAQVSLLKKPRYGSKKRGRKPGGKNRPKVIINMEKREKFQKTKKKGRPKGKKNPPKHAETQVFWFDKEVGRITPLGGASQIIAMSAKTIIQQFRGKHITTNLIEKEFSVLKKLLGERGNRSIFRWNLLIQGYFAVRNNPKVLKIALKEIKIPYSWNKISLRAQFDWKLNSCAV